MENADIVTRAQLLEALTQLVFKHPKQFAELQTNLSEGVDSANDAIETDDKNASREPGRSIVESWASAEANQ